MAIRKILAFSGVYLVSRLLLLGILFKLVGGVEFTSDLLLAKTFFEHPFRFFLGLEGHHQFPPLIGLAYLPFKWLSAAPEFVTYRLIYVVYDLVGFAVLLHVYLSEGLTRIKQQLPLIAMLLTPLILFSSVVMAQEESITLFISSLLCVALFYEKSRWALVFMVLGVLMGKIFFLLALPGLVVSKSLSLRDYLLACVAALIGFSGFIAYQLGGNVIDSFSPTYVFSIGIWAFANLFVPISDLVAKQWSLLLCLAIYGGIGVVYLLPYLRSKRPPNGLTTVALMNLLASVFFAFFYHVNMEYFLFSVPYFIMLGTRFPNIVALVVLVLGAGWVQNFIYGVSVQLSAGQSSVFTSVFNAVSPVSISTALIAAFVVSVGASMLYLGVSFSLFKKCYND